MKIYSPEKKNRSRWMPYWLVSPYIIYFLMFVAFPVVFSVVLTFHNWNIISPMQFIGWDNYRHLFQDRMFAQALYNTLRFLVVHIPLQITVALVLAEFMNQKIKGLAFFRAAFFLPVIVSGVVVTILWQQLYGYNSGILNRLISGLGFSRIAWLENPDMAMFSIAIMATWKNVGLYVVLFFVGLQSVPQQYYEAAKMEGASHWQQFWHITVPMINPTIFMIVILSTIGGFSLFIEPYIMTEGGPMNHTLSAVMYIYKLAFQHYHMGYSATLGICFTMLIVGVIMIQKKFIEKENV